MPPQQRREQLIDAALSVILQHGYGGVSIEAISRAAGVTRPVVYDHFPNLGRLLHALVEREERYALEQLEKALPSYSADSELEPALTEWGEHRHALPRAGCEQRVAPEWALLLRLQGDRVPEVSGWQRSRQRPPRCDRSPGRRGRAR